MRTSPIIGLAACVLSVVAASPVFAACSGASSPTALRSFNKAPIDWLAANKGKGDIGFKAEALAASAVNGNDAEFGRSLAAVLASASGDDGAAIGSALGGLVGTCSDPRDPGDKADKQYIAANIERNLLVNSAANTAYGQRGGPETAAASSSAGGGGGAGGSSGSGTGPTGNGIPTGGTNDASIPDGTTTTANVVPALVSGSVSGVGTTGVGTGSTSSSLDALTRSALSAADPSASTGSTFLLCYGSVNICGNSGNVTIGILASGSSPMSTTSLIR